LPSVFCGVGPKGQTSSTLLLFQKTKMQTWRIIKWIINHQGSKNLIVGAWSAIGITASSGSLIENVAFIFADNSTRLIGLTVRVSSLISGSAESISQVHPRLELKIESQQRLESHSFWWSQLDLFLDTGPPSMALFPCSFSEIVAHFESRLLGSFQKQSIHGKSGMGAARAKRG
jgi:hypothetical protein